MFHENNTPATAAIPVSSTSVMLMPSAAMKYCAPRVGIHENFLICNRPALGSNLRKPSTAHPRPASVVSSARPRTSGSLRAGRSIISSVPANVM